MAILATSRRWLVTSRCAASGSSCSFQRFASMYSCSGSSIGNLRISCRYRVRFPSEEREGTERVAIDDHCSKLGIDERLRRHLDPSPEDTALYPTKIVGFRPV